MPSAVIRRFDDLSAEEVLDVTFTTGRRYRAVLNRHVRGRFAFEKLA